MKEGLWDAQQMWSGSAVGGEASADGLVQNYGL